MKPTKTKEKLKLSNDQIAFFNRNFNAEAFEKAKKVVLDAISKSSSSLELWQNLSGYDRDIRYMDNYTVFLCDMELDRSKMETTADYVGVSLFIYWNERNNTAKIRYAELYSSESYNKEVLFWFGFNPNTYEIESLDQIVW